MAHIKLHDKTDAVVHEDKNFRLEHTGRLTLPRLIEKDGKLYQWVSTTNGQHKFKEKQ